VGFTERSIKLADTPESAEQQQQTQERPRRRREEPAKAEVPDLPVSQLVEESPRLLGAPTWVAAGALHDHEADDMLGIDAAKAAIKKFREHEVEHVGEEE
jgi:hypothetical protein